ncbi:MAG: DUF2147 domain-containing protein [Aestuariivirga sp.]
MKTFTSFAAAAMLLLAVGTAQADTGALGVWRMNNGKVTVRVANCGPNLCGTIIALAKPLDKKGRPKVDKDNPNPALRSRPVIGLRILNDMTPAGGNKWQGSIYNADDGRTYSSTMRLSGNNMKVKGCVLFICKSLTFTRVN